MPDPDGDEEETDDLGVALGAEADAEKGSESRRRCGSRDDDGGLAPPAEHRTNQVTESQPADEVRVLRRRLHEPQGSEVAELMRDVEEQESDQRHDQGDTTSRFAE
ncbi:hypothetical protein [Curtobacterium sp. 9128]|uniref:hypothetical protein n=1 Tax=Curtobacterium sp. 9128 TaxID=1793722 RepID=UPI00119CA510|nr:hypothetical protein [Curtobacterium sp. 9128]